MSEIESFIDDIYRHIKSNKVYGFVICGDGFDDHTQIIEVLDKHKCDHMFITKDENYIIKDGKLVPQISVGQYTTKFWMMKNDKHRNIIKLENLDPFFDRKNEVRIFVFTNVSNHDPKVIRYIDFFGRHGCKNIYHYLCC